MEKLKRTLKNILTFLVIFLMVNYIMQSCISDPDNQLPENTVIASVNSEFSRKKIAQVTISNNTDQTITIPNRCPQEPLNVFKKEGNDWIKQTASPELNCENAQDIKIAAFSQSTIAFDNWNYALFGETGRFRIEIESPDLEETITTNEFVVEKEGLISQLWNAIFYRPIYNLLILLISISPGLSLGLAIIFLTLLIRTALLAPSQKAMRAQKRIQEIQPKLEKIKQKYKGNQQMIAMQTMAIWKQEKISPLSGCLPILLQFPFLIALFYVIQQGLNPDNAYLLYTNYGDLALSDINTNFLGLNLLEKNLYVLPIIVGALQFFQMKMAMAKRKKPSKKHKMHKEMQMAGSMMTYFMPMLIALFTASLPAGVGLYWGTSTTFGIVQQHFINKTPSKKQQNEPTVKVIEPEDN